jgi:hypothetical protein
MTAEVLIHTLAGGPCRSTMIKEIAESVDEGVLVDGWETLTTEELIELYSVLIDTN